MASDEHPDLAKVLSAIRRAESSLGELRLASESAVERELILLRGLVHEIRNLVLPVQMGRVDPMAAIRGIAALLNTPLEGVSTGVVETCSLQAAFSLARALCSTWNIKPALPRRNAVGVTAISESAFGLVLNTLIANAQQQSAEVAVVIRRSGMFLAISVTGTVPHAATTRVPGWGIGLWTAASLVERVGGEMVFRAGEAGRTCGSFVVRIPLIRPASSPRRRTQSPNRPGR